MDQTVKIFNQWHSSEMFKYRKIAWSYLTQEYPNNQIPYHQLFNDQEKVQEEKVDALTIIATFWHLLITLEKSGMLDEKIVQELFSYQYYHWTYVLQPLYQKTVEDNRDIPEWRETFKEQNVKSDWIENSKRHVNTRMYIENKTTDNKK